MTRLQAACALFLLALPACGDDAADPRDQCTPTQRLVVAGRVGPTRLDVSRRELFPGGESGLVTITLPLQAEDAEGGTHLVSFTTNTVLEGTQDLWSLLESRLNSGAADAGLLAVHGRPSDVPCDPREGVVCAAFGVDTNGDAILFGPAEVVYPAAEGELRVTEVSGNELIGDFEISFASATSGGEDGGDEGGTLGGCFRAQRQADRTTLF